MEAFTNMYIHRSRARRGKLFLCLPLRGPESGMQATANIKVYPQAGAKTVQLVCFALDIKARRAAVFTFLTTQQKGKREN